MHKSQWDFSSKEWLAFEWPVTIVADRYKGTYSNGEWTAWPLDPSDLPVEIFGDDLECQRWWKTFRSGDALPIGIGATPNDALESLRVRIQMELSKKE